MPPQLVTPALLLRKPDAELSALAATGHDAAFTAIVLRHRGHLLRHCRRLLRDQRAEDAVQQTFMRALQALRSGTEVRELRPWLHRIAHNVALNELSVGALDYAELNDDWEDRSRSDEYDRRVALRETLTAVGALPDRQRAALLRSAAGETPDTISRDLGVTSVAVRQLVHRARVSVRAAVRVICPPPLLWLSRRAAAVFEKVPRVAGAPAGAAPVASKIAVAVVVSATVAAPATVIHSIVAHRSRPTHAHRLPGSRAGAVASHLVASRHATSSPLRLGAPRVATAAPSRVVSPGHPVRSRLVAAAAPPRPPSTPKPSSHAPTPSGDAAGVGGSSPYNAPVRGSAPFHSSTGAPIIAGQPAPGGTDSNSSVTGPTASASASSTTGANAGSVDPSSSTSTSTDSTPTDPSASTGSASGSSTAADGSPASP